MFRRKNSNTKVGNVEKKYGVDLNARSDATLGNLLQRRGFDSQSQLIKAYKGQLTDHARTRKLFLSFHHEDRHQVNGFRLMSYAKNLPIDFHDGSVRSAVNSEASAYLRSVIRNKISRCSVLVCLVGNGTAWRDWVEWEIRTAIELCKGICAVRLKGSRGRAPKILNEIGVKVTPWDANAIVAAIECAAARRS